MSVAPGANAKMRLFKCSFSLNLERLAGIR
jgi:hypothetical protein